MSPIATVWSIFKCAQRQCSSLAMVLLLLACSAEDDTGVPTILRLGVLPDQTKAALLHRYTPLIAHLKKELEVDVQLVIPESYQDLVRRFGAGDLDIAYFGGTTFVASLIRYNAVPLVMRDIDIEFSTYFVANAQTPATGVESFRAKRFSFGAQSSTSGHLMPRFFLQDKGITPETFFAETLYSGAHDKTVGSVLDGSVDLGAVNSQVVNNMLRDGRLKPGLLRVVWETPPYADYVWAVRSNLDEGFQDRLRDTFMALTPLNEPDDDILGRMGTKGFLPARREDFKRLREIMASLPQFREMTGASTQ